MGEWSRRDMTRARGLYAKRKGSIDQLVAGKRPLTWRHREDERFFEAMQEAAAWQFLRKPEAFEIHPATLEFSKLPLELPTPGPKDARRTARLALSILRQAGYRRWTYRVENGWFPYRQDAPELQLNADFEGELGGGRWLGVYLPRCKNGLYHTHRGMRFIDGRFILAYGPCLAVSAPPARVQSCTCGYTSPGLEFTKS